jgi:DNA mismatch repair protein MutH
MEPKVRSQTLNYLKAILPGKNLYDLASMHSVSVFKDGRLNKGWVGQTVEQVARLDAGSSQRRDGADFELKTTSLLPSPTGWKPKETIKITQLSPQVILEEDFETSALWNKLSSLILVGCHHETTNLCHVVRVSAIDIDQPDLVAEIKLFWEEVRLSVCMGEFAQNPVGGTSLDYIQLRGLGRGTEWSTCPITGDKFQSRAFYGTKRLISRIFQL